MFLQLCLLIGYQLTVAFIVFLITSHKDAHEKELSELLQKIVRTMV